MEQLVPAAQSFETACKALLLQLSPTEQLLAELRLRPKCLEESWPYLQVWPRLGVGVCGMSQAQRLVFVHRRCVREWWHAPGTWKGFCRLARGWQSFSLVSGPQLDGHATQEVLRAHVLEPTEKPTLSSGHTAVSQVQGLGPEFKASFMSLSWLMVPKAPSNALISDTGSPSMSALPPWPLASGCR